MEKKKRDPTTEPSRGHDSSQEKGKGAKVDFSGSKESKWPLK